MSEFLDFTTLRRPTAPNTCLLAPKGFCDVAKVDTDSPRFPVPPAQLFAQIVDWVALQRRWTIRQQDDVQMRLSAVVTTGLMRFRDDVDIAVLAGDDAVTSQLAIYSRSRVGYSDLGTNAKRVSNLVNSLQVGT